MKSVSDHLSDGICAECGHAHSIGAPHGPASTESTTEQAAMDSGEMEQTVELGSQPTEPQPQQPAHDPLIGKDVGERYHILERISQGGMGVVYKARHNTLGNLVAVKVLLGLSPDARARFLSEAKLASKVQHPNTVYVADYGVLPDGRPYLVMEFISAPTLGKLLRAGRIDLLRSCQIALQIARGMQPIHDKGIVHRDLKPDNIFVLEQDGQSDFAKIVDFGIAKETQQKIPQIGDSQSAESTAAESATQPPGEEQHRTALGMLVGTPAYMAPEQVRGQEITPLVDQYALGCILYKMLTGTVPFESVDSVEVMYLHMTSPVVPPQQRCPEAGISDSLGALVLRCLAKDQTQRFPSMRELAAALTTEIDLLRIQRGERVGLPSPDVKGNSFATLRVGSIQIPAWLVLVTGTVCLTVLGMVAYFRWTASHGEPELRSGELASLYQRSLDTLEEFRRGPELELRLRALEALGQTRDVRVYAGIAESLRSPDLETQAQASRSLGRLGERKALPLLHEQIKKSDSQLRSAAGQALLLLGDESGRELLTTALGSKLESEKLQAALLLCEVGEPAANSYLRSLAKPTELRSPVERQILGCLIKERGSPLREQVLSHMQSTAALDTRLSAAALLLQVGEPQARTLLSEQVQKPGPLQLIAARFLATPGEEAPAALFRRVLRSQGAESAARVLAADGLGTGGIPKDTRLLGEQLAATSEPRLRLTAAAGIALLSRSDPGILSEQGLLFAQSAMGDPSWLVRRSAATVLGEIHNPESVSLLQRALKDEVPGVRLHAIKSLARQRGREVLTALRTGLADTDAAVRAEAAWALAGQKAEIERTLGDGALVEIRRFIQQHLGQDLSLELIRLRGALLRLGDTSQRDSLLALISSGQVSFRLAAIAQLDGDADALLGFLQDVLFEVRLAAAQRLAMLGDRRAIPVLSDALSRGGASAVVGYGLLRRLGESPAAPNTLQSGLQGNTPAERLVEVASLPYLPGELLNRTLSDAVVDPDSAVRRQLASLLADQQLTPSVRPLWMRAARRLLDDSETDIRIQAASFLSRHRGPELAPTNPSRQTESSGTDHAGAAKKSGTQTPASGATTAPATKVAITATTAPIPSAEAAPANAAKESSVGAPAAEEGGVGILILTSEQPVQFQIDRRPWQAVTKQPISLPSGEHSVRTLSAVHSVSIAPGGTVSLALDESPIEQFSRKGQSAFEQKDFRKAQKLLEKTKALCGRAKKNSAGCAGISIEASARLGQVYEAQERWAEAMAEYQSALAPGGPHIAPELRAEVQATVNRLAPRLGQVILPKRSGSKCEEVTMYMPPGTHMVVVNGKAQTFTVRARETVRAGSCD